jgi:tRNA (mo5U34)-methyltransferase
LTETLIFDQQHYDLLNRARWGVVAPLLAEIRGPLALKTVVDVGCGPGHFSALLQSLGFEITGVDGRQRNVQEAQQRNPGIRFLQFDAEDPAMRSLGKFDLVFCFGLLYHLENPLLAIRHLKAMTCNLLLAEGVIFPGDAPTMGLVDEGSFDDQGLNHVAFYPTESCLQKMFYCAGFRFVYRFTSMPDHPGYHQRGTRPRIRTILAASHELIASPLLEVVPQPSTPIQPWDAENVAANTSSVEALRGFTQKPLSGKIRALNCLVRSKISARRREGG